MKCTACGSEIETISRQLRSADEGRTFIQTCPKCPLAVSKLTGQRKTPHIHVARESVVRSQLPVLSCQDYSIKYILSIHVRSLKQNISFHKLLSYNAVGVKEGAFKCHISGPYSGLAMREVSRIQVGPYASVISYNTTYCPTLDKGIFTLMEYCTKDEVTYCRSLDDITITYALTDNSVASICAGLRTIYLAGYDPTSLHGIISSSKLSAQSNLTARAWDENTANPDTHIFSTKPDGDRHWLTRVGVVWIGSNRLTGHIQKYWIIDDTVPEEYIQSTGPCIDIEVLHTGLSTNIQSSETKGNPILIDILMDHKGNISPQQRTIDWIYSQMTLLQEIFPYLSVIHRRLFRSTLEDAIKDRRTCGYPTDGIVAINKQGTDMLKIKSIKSIELKIDEEGVLSTEDNIALFKVSSNTSYLPGSIVEVKFMMVDNKLDIKEYFLRTDKTIANKIDVLHAIMLSTMSERSPNILRNQLWRWSNSVREYLYRVASRICEEKQIILDIGTGDGQGIDSLPNKKSYIFIEPDMGKCIRLARNLNISTDKIRNHPRLVVPGIGRMIKGHLRYQILNSTLQDFLADATIRDNIKSLIGCCVSSLSAQFVVDCMSTLYDLQIPFVGSCYMYDGIEVGQSIIDSSGISMKRISQSTGVVKWGSDKEYEEPALERADIHVESSIMPAVDNVPYTLNDETDPGFIASRYMQVLIYK